MKSDNTMKPETTPKQHILECLAHQLETSPGERITTAQLAKEVGTSEAALYRHFPSKAKMFEGLIVFAEKTIFSRITRILAEAPHAIDRCNQLLILVLTFAQRNPGITRLLMGDILTGETRQLRTRVNQLFDRIETQIKQLLREAEIQEGLRTVLTIRVTAQLLTTVIEGRLAHYVRSEFQCQPTNDWHEQWAVLADSLFKVQLEAGKA